MRHVILKSWNESKHPRRPGGDGGGQFIATGSAGEAVLSAVETELGAASMAQTTVYHGSSRVDLTVVSGGEVARQFDNATSQFGAFFAPDIKGAQRYGANIYTAGYPVKNPYEMPTKEFHYFQSINRSALDADGFQKTLPSDQWEGRAKELKVEAIARRNELEQQGYDGIVTRIGGVTEVASFKDVPVHLLKWVEKRWDPSKHPRVPAGSSAGGQFGSASGALGKTMEDIVGGDIRPPKEDVYEVADATSNAMRVVGNATANVDNLAGGVALADPEQRVRIDRLKHAITGAGGYFERVIVDQNGGVVEGQHRLDAARELGVKSIPVVLVNDLDHNGALARLKTAVKATGQIRTENARQIARQVLDMAAEVGPDKIEAEFDMPKGYEPAFKAAIAALKPDDVITDVEAIARLAGIPSNIQKLNNASDRPLYVHRELLNPDDVRAWAKEQGFTSTLEPADMHVTVAFSKEPVDWSSFEPDDGDLIVPATTDAAARSIRALGPNGEAIVLSFASPDLEERWQELCDGGCSWDYPDYKPHVTLTYSGAPLDLRSIRPYMGELRFGPEIFEPINENAASRIKESVTKALSQLFAGLTGILKGDPGAGDMHVDQPMGSDKPRRRRKPAVMDDEDEPMMQAQMIAKSDDESRLVFGWGSVISKNGVPVVDTQEDVITPAELLKSTTEFMENVRYAAEMHPRDENQNFTPDMAKGQVVHSFPLTADIAKALGIQTDREGWIIGVKVHDDDVWKRVKDGTLKGFSIGASALRVPL